MTDEPKITVLYNPENGMVGCVLLNALLGDPSYRKVVYMFDARDWQTFPSDGLQRMSATPEQWRKVASMTREERVESYRKFCEQEAHGPTTE
jgi:hypothetical protein